MWIALAVLASCKTAIGEGVSRPDTGRLHYLDASTRELVQPIEPADAVHKFVRVEVAEVVNPKMHGVIFELYYQAREGERSHVGGFALYPSDHPGRFLVATQGKVKNGGALVLVLTSPDKVERGDPLRVGIARIELVEK